MCPYPKFFLPNSEIKEIAGHLSIGLIHEEEMISRDTFPLTIILASFLLLHVLACLVLFVGYKWVVVVRRFIRK